MGRSRRHAGGLILLLAFALAARADLPALGTAGKLPPEKRTLRVAVDKEGVVTVNGSEVTLEELAARLEKLARKHKSGFQPGVSRLHVLLAVDATVPWKGVQWILSACFRAKVYRVFYEVKHPDGPGAVALYLPLARERTGIGEDPQTGRLFRVDVATTLPPAPPALLYLALGGRVAALPEERRDKALVRIRAGHFVPAGAVLQAADAALRAGVSRLDLFDHLVPAKGDSIAKLVEVARKRGTRPVGYRLGKEVLEGAAPPMPSRARSDKVAGYAPVTGGEMAEADD